jgi:hypothetical protein
LFTQFFDPGHCPNKPHTRCPKNQVRAVFLLLTQ